MTDHDWSVIESGRALRARRAKQRSQGKKDRHRVEKETSDDDESVDGALSDVITDIECVILCDYARCYRWLGITGAGRECLPPGLDKCDLSSDPLAQLPRRSERQKLITVGSDVLLVDTATRIILDVLHGVLTAANSQAFGQSGPMPTWSPARPTRFASLRSGVSRQRVPWTATSRIE